MTGEDGSECFGFVCKESMKESTTGSHEDKRTNDRKRSHRRRMTHQQTVSSTKSSSSSQCPSTNSDQHDVRCHEDTEERHEEWQQTNVIIVLYSHSIVQYITTVIRSVSNINSSS